MWDTRKILLVVATILVTILTGCAEPDGPQPPNLIIISLDTLRADHLGLYGYSRGTSPHLDSFAGTSVVFRHALSQSGSTTPAHRALFQSCPATAYKRGKPMLAEVLAAHGYATAAFTGGGNIAAQLGFGRGFDRYVEEKGGLAATEDAVRAWLEEQGQGPFFLFLHTYDIHLPYDPPPPHDNLFFPEYEGDLAGSHTVDLLQQARRIGRYRDLDTPLDVPAEDRRRVVALYDGGIHYADLLVGRFLAELRDLGLDRNTHVVLLSDHGEEFWEHGSVIHSHTVYQELIHIPLVWRFPDRRHAGQRIDRLVRLMDVAPTALDLLGLPIPEKYQGQSLIPLLEGREKEPRTSISEMKQLRAWTTDDWKLIFDWATRTEQLFHLRFDPAEQTDLREAYPEVALRLLEEMLKGKGGGTESVVNEMDPGVMDTDLRDRLMELGYVEE